MSAISSTDLEQALRPDLPLEERSAALERLMIDAWSRGWDDCAASFRDALEAAAITLDNMPQRKAVH